MKIPVKFKDQNKLFVTVCARDVRYVREPVPTPDCKDDVAILVFHNQERKDLPVQGNVQEVKATIHNAIFEHEIKTAPPILAAFRSASGAETGIVNVRELNVSKIRGLNFGEAKRHDILLCSSKSAYFLPFHDFLEKDSMVVLATNLEEVAETINKASRGIHFDME